MILVVKTFRLKAGADESAFLEADERLQREFTFKQPGLLECTTAKGTGGEWVVLHLWTSAQAADGPRGARDPAVEAWADFIDQSTAKMARFGSIDG